MTFLSRSLRRGLSVSAAVALLLGPLAGSAQASPETLTRGATNLFFGPIDMLLGVVNGPRSVYNNLQYVDDTMPVRIAFAVPGAGWNIAMNMAGGFARLLAGMIETPVGLVLLPFEADLDPLYAPAEKAPALIDEVAGPVPIRIGLSYVD